MEAKSNKLALRPVLNPGNLDGGDFIPKLHPLLHPYFSFNLADQEERTFRCLTSGVPVLKHGISSDP